MGNEEQYHSRYTDFIEMSAKSIYKRLGYRVLQQWTTQAPQVPTATPVLPQSHQGNGGGASSALRAGKPVIRGFEHSSGQGWYEFSDTNPCFVRAHHDPKGFESCISFSSWVYLFTKSPGWKEVAMSGFDPNDIQCCDTRKLGSRIIVDGKYHTIDCPYANSFYNKNYNLGIEYTVSESDKCSHTFVPYTGMSETFEYCVKCDEKRK